MAVDRSRPLETDSVFTYQPKIGELSNKIAQSLQDDFLTRQQKHVEKQRHLLELSLPPAFRKIKLAPISKQKSPPSSDVATEITDSDKTQTPDEQQNMSKATKDSKEPDNKVHQMISSSPYSKDPIVVKRRHQSKPDYQRASMSKSIGAVDAIVTRRERSASPPPLRPSRSRTMPSFTSNNGTLGKAIREPTSCTLDRLQRAHELVERAINEKKIFCIAGTYYALRESLRERGWVEKFCFVNGASGGVTSTSSTTTNGAHKAAASRPKTRATDSSDSDDNDDDCDATDDEEDKTRIPPWEEDNGFYGIMSRMLKNYLPNFVFTTKTSTIDYKMLQKDQIVNHYGKNSCLTTKNGLCVNLRNLPWYEPVDPNVFFPRCYKISTDEEKQDFIDDFRVSACQAVVKWILEKLEPRAEKSRPPSAISTKPVNADSEKSPGSENPPSSNQPAESSAANSSPLARQKSAPPGKPSNTGGNNNNGALPAKFLDIAVEQCEKYLTEKEHGYIDVLREPNTLNDVQWDQFLGWYYQLVHGHGRLTALTHSVERLRNLAQRLDAVHPQFRMDGCRNIWIVKPGAKSRGRGVQCYARLDEIIKLVSSAVMKDGKYVVQKYIERPLLIYDTKFDIRQWFLVTSWNPLTMWFFQDCYLRFCSQLFTLEKFDESVHLSNNSIQCNYSNAKERSPLLPDENMWTSDTFKAYLANELGQSKVWDEIIYPGMRNAVIYTLEACQDIIADRRNSFELFGADFMLTEDFQPLLIEVNCSPCLAPSTAVTAKMCPQVQEDLLKVILDRRADKGCNIGRFELAYRQQLVSAPNYLGLSLAVEGQNCGPPAVFRPTFDRQQRCSAYSSTGRRAKPVVTNNFPTSHSLRSTTPSTGSSNSDSESDSENNKTARSIQPNRQRKAQPALKAKLDVSTVSWNPIPRATVRCRSRQGKKSEGLAETIFEEENGDDDEDDVIGDVMNYQPDDDITANDVDESADKAENTANLDGDGDVDVQQFRRFSRPKAGRVDLRDSSNNNNNIRLPRGRFQAAVATTTADRNRQLVANIMTYHPPLPSRRPRTFFSYSSFIPSRVLKGPMFISHNTLETILNRAKDICVSAGVMPPTGTMQSGDAAGDENGLLLEDRSRLTNYTFPKHKQKKAMLRRSTIAGTSHDSYSPVRKVALTFQTSAPFDKP